MVELSREIAEQNFCLLVEHLFSLPEIECIQVRKTVIRRENIGEMIKKAVDESYHDIYSDIDLNVVVNLQTNGAVSSEAYVKKIEHWFFDSESILGICFVPESSLYRIVLKNGIRYDLSFAISFSDRAPAISLKPMKEQDENIHWSIANINRFWFVQIQALGKLYRDDFLISGHLANMNINETLVQQMILRDIKHHTNHHRYGYKEELAYQKYLTDCPYKTGNIAFDDIAARLYSAALAYDELTSCFYEEYEPRSEILFEIWNCYEGNRKR